MTGNLDLELLQVEIERIGVMVQRAVLLWQLAGQDANDKFRGLVIRSEEAKTLAFHKWGENWGSAQQLSVEQEQELIHSSQEIQNRIQQVVEQARQNQENLLLANLIAGFQLSSFEYDVFLVCLAPALDLRFERLYGFLQDDVTRKSASPNLILDLMGVQGSDRLQYLDRFSDQATLVKYGLIRKSSLEANQAAPLLRQSFTVPPELISYLQGFYRTADELADSFSLNFLDSEPSSALSIDQIDNLEIERLTSEQSPLIAFFGSDRQRQQSVAEQIARILDRPLFQIRLERCKAAGLLNRSTLRLAVRDAILTGAIPYFTDWEEWLDEDGLFPENLLSELNAFQTPVIVSSRSEWRISALGSTSTARPVIQWRFDLPDTQQRRQLWSHYLGASNGSQTKASSNHKNDIDESEIGLLAGQFALTSDQIRDAVWNAHNLAFQEGRPMNTQDLFLAARGQSSHHLDSLAVKLHPRYIWNDIVLPKDELEVLKEIVSTVQERPLVLEEWGLGKKLVASAGISALFAGPPGTGKTLAAQVIAAELGMDLYKIDLSTVVSKYIGETEKNLERIFTQARNSNTILFFDEADAIFGKRSEVKDAHDRYANIEVGYLLQRMESYDGIVILATNLRANLDDAFTRRLQFVVNFPFPEAQERLNIWQVLLPPELPRDSQIDFASLAQRFEMTGGSIRNAIVSAAFLAANDKSRVTTRHLLHGVRREMQKMGRLLNDEDYFQLGKDRPA